MKQQRKKKRSGEPLSYWQSTADMMSALLLILLLVIMLLLLYIIQIPEEEYVDSYPGSYSSSAASSEPEDDWDDDWDGGGWGGWGGGGGGGDGEDDYQYPTPGGGGGTGIGIGFGKTAVYVMVVDAETQATIKEAGITFELYTADGGIQFLNTYYPQKIEYRQYNTTDQGVFYLPEKIFQGDYYLHELNEPDGYVIYWIANEIFHIKDMIFNNEDARTGLWNFVSAHFSMIDQVQGDTYTDEPLAFLLEDASIKETISPYYMARIVDFPFPEIVRQDGRRRCL